MSQLKKLAILIPTRSRSNLLSNTIRRLVKSIIKSGFDCVEIVVVDNFSKDNTKEVVQAWIGQYNFIKYYHQLESRNSAEESTLYALDFVDAEYIWICGDDDFPLIDCIDNLFSIISQTEANLIFLSFDRFVKNSNQFLAKIYNNCNFSSDLIEYDKGCDLFYDFGFITLTSLLPCICFKNGTLDKESFLQLIKVSQIYSHSFALLCSYFDSKVAFSNKKLITYRVPNQELYISDLTRQKNYKYYQWTNGILDLAVKTEEIIRNKNGEISLNRILRSQEMQPIMEFNTTRNSILWCVVIRMYESQILDFSNLSNEEIANEDNNIRLYIENFIKIIREVNYSNNFAKQILYLQKILEKKLLEQSDFKSSIIQEVKDISLHIEDRVFIRNMMSNITKLTPIVGVNNFCRVLNKNIIESNTKVLSLVLKLGVTSADYLFSILRFFDNYKINQIKDLEIIVIKDDDFIETTSFLDYLICTNVTFIDKSLISSNEDLTKICSGKYIWNIQNQSFPLLANFYYLINILRNSDDELIVAGTHIDKKKFSIIYEDPFGISIQNFVDNFFLDGSYKIEYLIQKIGFIRFCQSVFIFNRNCYKKFPHSENDLNILFSVFSNNKLRFINSSVAISDDLESLISKDGSCQRIIELFDYLHKKNQTIVSKILISKSVNRSTALSLIKIFCNELIYFIKFEKNNLNKSYILTNYFLSLERKYFNISEWSILSKFNKVHQSHILSIKNNQSYKYKKYKKEYHKISLKIASLELKRKNKSVFLIKSFLLRKLYKKYKILLKILYLICYIFSKCKISDSFELWTQKLEKKIKDIHLIIKTFRK